MNKLLFHLRNVEEDEAEEVRTLLDEAEIPFYETSAGRWRISLAAIWVKDSEDFAKARALIDAYQQQRSERIRQEPQQSFWQRSKEQPLELFFSLLAVVVIVAIMIWPFATWLS